MIRVEFYPENESERSHDYETPEKAFEQLQQARIMAIAYPTGTTSGCWCWTPDNKPPTLEEFKAQLNRCS